MSKGYNKLMVRQMRKHLRNTLVTPELERFFQAVSDSYDHEEKGRLLLERTMERSSAELLAKNEELRAKNDTLDSFVYRVSHDLKTPANNFVSMLKMLNDFIDIDEQSPMVARILSNLDLASRTMQVRIHDLLEMTRIEHKLSEKPVRISLTEMMAEIKTSLKADIAEAKAEIIQDFSEVNNVLFGRENMLSILSNLLGNALKYRHVDRIPQVFIRGEHRDGCFVLTIQDNGMGMNLERDGKRLFTMFARLHNHVEGTGIGLYLVKKIIENNGGSISVNSQINHGTNFTINLPDEIICN